MDHTAILIRNMHLLKTEDPKQNNISLFFTDFVLKKASSLY